ncbi:HPP family protein [Pseudomonas sp. Marseille-QA0892]
MSVKAAGNSSVDTSAGSDSTRAWDEAAAQAKEVGIRWERPEDDKRSAQEIIDDTPLLKNLGNQSGVKDKLKERVGDFDNDADAAYRAAQVLEHIEKYDEKGERLVGGDTENGRVDGFTSQGHAKHGTEAGRLQDFGKYGFTHLKGELNHIDDAPNNNEAKEQAEALGIEWVRPEGDDRSAEEIINDSPLLKNLGNQSGVKDMLKERVGDFENDADAAHRAVQVLEHVVSFDGDGNRLVSDDVRNSSIDGFTSSGEARNGTEAGRLQDFGKYGFSSLKGELQHAANASENKEAREQAEALGIVWERPANDKRTAEEIIDGDPLLKNLGNQSGIKDMLKERVGDFETDADAAFRASQVLEHIEKHDADGNVLEGGDIGNGIIDGMTKGGEARNGTEAGRLQDFGKYGFSSLKGPEPTDESRIDFERKKAGLPPASELDIGNLETTTTDANDKNKKLTVSEMTWQTLMKDWKAGIDSGTIAKDDDRAKMYNALRAQAASENGLDMVTLDMSMGQSTTRADGQDFETIIDREKVNEQVAELFGSESVQKDFLAAQAKATDALPDKDGVREKLEETAFSEEYSRYIADLKESGKGELAEADINKTYASLAAFDPDKAAQFSQHMMIDATTMDLDKLMSDPSLISDDNTALATQDTIKTLLTALKKGGVDLPRRTVEFERFIQEFLGDKQTAKAFGNALKELGAKFAQNGTITADDINKVMSKDVYKTLGEGAHGSMLKTITEMNGNGLLGTAGGMISLASGIYQLAGKGGSLADTPEERLAVAKDFVSVLGAGQHFVNLGSNIFDSIKGTQVNQMLGLDKSLPEIFGNDKPDGKGRNISLVEGEVKKLFEDFNAAIDAAPIDSKEKLGERLNMSNEQLEKINEGFRDGFAKNPGLNGSTPTTRGISAFLRVMDAGANTFTGAADVVLGGLKIKSASDSGDKVGIAQGAITVAAGAFNLAGGGAQMAALMGVSAARAIAGPLLWAGAALTVALTPFLIVEDIKHNNRMDAHRDDLNQLFNDLNDQGLLTEDGLQRYEFLDSYMYNYAQRDAPDDQSIFEYRDEEYEFFSDEGRLPEEGWDKIAHNDYDGDGSNLQTRMDKGSTVGA